MFAQLQIGVPVWTAAGWFITNSIEAFIGAYCITKFTGSARRLDGVRGVFVFVVFGVLVAPLSTSFLDAAAVVITGRGFPGFGGSAQLDGRRRFCWVLEPFWLPFGCSARSLHHLQLLRHCCIFLFHFCCGQLPDLVWVD
jgi:hypothetical protein